MNIRIITDSSSDIPWDYADKHNIKVVSLSVIYDEKSYKEDRNYDLDKHYQKYVDNKDFLPKTSQPSPKEYLQAYEDLAREGAKDILNIHVSNKLSGTANSINIATKIFREQNKDVTVHVWDTRHASYAEVFFIKEAIDLIEQGLNPEEIIAKLEELRPNVTTFILVPTLKYFHAGGRISLGKYLLSRLLRKKVITTVLLDGSNVAAGTVTNFNDGLEKLVEMTTENYTKFPKKCAIMYASNIESAYKLKEIVEQKIPEVEAFLIQTKCTVSVHTGPEAVALISNFGYPQ